MNVESYPPLETDQVPDFILNDSEWWEYVALAEAKQAELMPFLKSEYSRILSLCRRKGGEEDTAEIALQVIHEFLDQIQIALYVKMDVSRIRKSAAHEYRSPGAWLTRVATFRLKDFLRNQSCRRKTFQFLHELQEPRIYDVDGDLIDRNPFDGLNESIHCTPFRNRERYLLSSEQRASDRLFVRHYRVALTRLSVPRRRAWVLCNDEFLEPDDAENLLKLKSARAAKITWPKGMPIKDAARLLRCAEGTVSSNVSRARDDLRRELADLDPLKASRSPAPKCNEFLGSPFGVLGSIKQIDFAVTPLLGPLPAKVSAGPTLPTRTASDFIIDYARAISRPLQIPANQERVSEPTQEIEHNLPVYQDREFGLTQHVDEAVRHKRRENLPFPKGLKKISYRCGSSMKGCRNCGETKLIRTQSGRSKTIYKSGFAVFRSYAPSQTGWTFWCYECGAKDDQCWSDCQGELGKPPLLQPGKADALFFW